MNFLLLLDGAEKQSDSTTEVDCIERNTCALGDLFVMRMFSLHLLWSFYVLSCTDLVLLCTFLY